MTKTKHWILLAAIVLVGCAVGEEVEAPQAQRSPNVVLIVADDLGWRDVSFNGGDIATPTSTASPRRASGSIASTWRRRGGGLRSKLIRVASA